MPTWGWIVIGVVVGLALIAAMAWIVALQMRTQRLRRRFGSEYDRTVEAKEDRRKAEAELAGREQRRSQFDIRPLARASRERYLVRWEQVQAEFVDSPSGAVAAADQLIQSVMTERGYPVEDFDQRAADLSVDHPGVVENYREGHRLALRNASGESSTEDLRRAMQRYRSLFDELLEEGPDDSSHAATERATGRERVGR